MNNIVYKVIWHRFGRPKTSYLASGKARVYYKVGEWAEAPEWLQEKGYHLLVFETLEQARQFLPFPQTIELEIWEAEAEDRYALPPMLNTSKLYDGEFLEARINWWPWGTLMYKRIKLIRRVY